MCKNTEIGIITFVPDLWNDSWLSRHHILTKLSNYYKVLWISPPLYWSAVLRRKVKFSQIYQRGLQKISQSLWCYAAIIPADFTPKRVNSRFPKWISKLYSSSWKCLYVLKIKRLQKLMKIEKVILYIWRPEFADYIDTLKEKIICYHIVDEYTFDPDFNHPTSDTEKWLIRKSDMVFIHSKTMFEKKGHLNPSTFYIPHGVDFKQYSEIQINDPHEIEDVLSKPHPRIGYVGHIKRHLDLQLLLKLSQERENWSVILIGKIRENHTDIQEEIRLLKERKNVYFLGSKNHDDLPKYINQLDVCLLCYKKTQYTKYIFPLKFFEYLASGKPVVATKLPNLEEFNDLIYFAEGYKGWIEKIDCAINRDSKEEKEKRIQYAKKNAWDDRVNFIKSKIEEKIKE